MGRASIRQAAYNYFTNAGIPNLGTVFAARPFVVNEDDYDTSMAAGLIQYITSSSGSSGIMIVNISESGRRRNELTGFGAVGDFTVHQMELEVFFANTAGDAIAAQTDHDTTMDSIVIAIRADPTLGTAGNPGTIFGAGVFQSVPITVHQGSPFWDPDGTTVFIPSIVRFEAWEHPSGTGV